jgi:hypothetical protein
MSDINRAYHSYVAWALRTCGRAASFDVWLRTTGRIPVTNYASDVVDPARVRTAGRQRRPVVRVPGGVREVALPGCA